MGWSLMVPKETRKEPPKGVRSKGKFGVEAMSVMDDDKGLASLSRLRPRRMPTLHITLMTGVQYFVVGRLNEIDK